MKYAEDILCLIGLALLGGGLGFKYDWPTAAIVTGGLLIVLGIVAAVLASRRGDL